MNADTLRCDFLVIGVRKGRVGPNIDDEILRDEVYVNRSRYGSQLGRYLELFDKNQLLVVTFEEFVHSFPSTWLRFCTHLGISSEGVVSDPPRQKVSSNRRIPKGGRSRGALRRFARTLAAIGRLIPDSVLYHRSTTRPRLQPDVRRELWRQLEGDVRFLEDVFGLDCATWRRRHE